MKKIVIFRDEYVDQQNSKPKRVRTVLRTIRPDASFVGFTKSGQAIDGEIKTLAKYLEPKFTGYYIS